MPVDSGIDISATPSAPSISLRWFLRLRWVAALGQAAAILAAHFHFRLELPWVQLLGVLLVTVFSNHWFQDSRDTTPEKSARRLGMVICIDIVLLTVMLHFTGGIHNPFVGFYLLLVAAGAMTVSGRTLWLLLLITLGCMISICVTYLPFAGPTTVVQGGKLIYPVFITSWISSLFMIGACIAVFLRRLSASLRHRDLLMAQAERRIEDANRFQSLATLAAGVAHELGSPLGTIAIASKDLIRDLGKIASDGTAYEDALLIRSEVERCRQILKRLDRSSTRGTGEVAEECDVAEIFRKLMDLLPERARERLSMDDLTDGRRMSLAVQAVLQSLVVLVENACDADPGGGVVSLTARIDGDDIRFQVLDSGHGISESEKRRIGTPFYTTKKDQSGMGLGLFLVQTLTTNLGGSCTLAPRPDGGTCATLSLPLQSNP